MLTFLNDDKMLIDEAMSTALFAGSSEYDKIVEAMRYSALGGKRLRGILTLEFAKMFGCETAEAMAYAVGVECIQAYSLIHDDLPCMDDDDMRRGKPSCHIAFGEANALLAGDALLTGRFSSSDIIIIHARKIIMYKRVCLDTFNSNGIWHCFIEIASEHFCKFKGENSAKTFSAKSGITHGFDYQFIIGRFGEKFRAHCGIYYVFIIDKKRHYILRFSQFQLFQSQV